MKPPLSLVPLFPVTVAFAAGTACGLAEISLWWSIIPIVAAVTLGWRGYRYFAVLAVAAALGFAGAWLRDDSADAAGFRGKELAVKAFVTDVRESQASRSFTVRIIAAGADTSRLSPVPEVKARIVVPSFMPDVQAGQTVTMKCFFSSGGHIEYIPQQFDFDRLLARHGIYLSGLARPDDIYRVEPTESFSAKMLSMRQKIWNLILRSPLSTATKEFLVTAITGDDSVLGEDTREAFADAGIAHVLALSGLHVGILTLFASLLMLPLIINSYTRKAIPILTIAVLWAFAIVTGMSPSVTRAVVMATVLILSSMMQRRHSPYNSLCLAALIILVFDPHALLNISFQLSFAAVAGILAFSTPLNPVSPKKRIAYTLSGLLTVSIGAMLATGLLSAFYFHRFPAFFIVANVLSSPLLIPLIGGGMLLVLTEAAGITPGRLCSLLDGLFRGVDGIAAFTARLPGAGADNIHIPLPVLIIGIAAVIFLACAVHFKRRFYYYGAAVCLAGSVLTAIATPRPGAEGVYIVPSTYRTDIIVSTPSTFHIITSEGEREHESIRKTGTVLYGDYMNSRGIDSIKVTSSQLSADKVHYEFPVLTTPSATVLIADGRSEFDADSTAGFTYLLVCRGQRADITPLLHCADTIILSADLHPRRHDRYAAECAASGSPCISLKTRPLPNLY